MKAGRNQQLDYLLINLAEKAQLPNQEQATIYRNKFALNRREWSWTGTQQYNEYSPGVRLYFSLLKNLIILSCVLSISSLPCLISNYKGNGLSLYSLNSKHLTLGEVIMKLSLANQPTHQSQLLQSTTNVFPQSTTNVFPQSTTNALPQETKSKMARDHSGMEHLMNIKMNKLIIIMNDIFRTVICLAFLIYWQIQSESIVQEMLRKGEGLPSYYTLIVYPIGVGSPFTQEQLYNHFAQFGQVSHVELIYSYDDLLMKVKSFIELVDQYNEQFEPEKKELLYDEIQTMYMQIKSQFIKQTQIKHQFIKQTHSEIESNHLPFRPVKAFVQFKTIQIRDKVRSFYHYQVQSQTLQLKHLHVQRCHVEPMSVIWENFHFRNQRDCCRCCLFGIVVTFLIFISLFCILLLSLHMTDLINGHQSTTAINTFFTNNTSAANATANGAAVNGAAVNSTAVNGTAESRNIGEFVFGVTSNDSKVYKFCSGLNYKTFEWRYYEVCSSYLAKFELKWIYILALSVLVVVIALILTKIVFLLAQFRRHRTLPQRKIFLIIAIFITYFLSSSIITFIIRAEFGKSQYSLVHLVKTYLPDFLGQTQIETYAEFNQKWYMEIGKLLLINFILSMIICPWLYIFQEWVLQQIRLWWARRAPTQKQMNALSQDREFYFQFYYAVILNCLYFTLLLSIAMPILLVLSVFSMLSFFLSSKIIFHKLCRIPDPSDHKINSAVTKIISFSLLLHQISSIFFVEVDDIFPTDLDQHTTIWHRASIFIFIFAILLIYICYQKNIVRIFKKKHTQSNDLLVMSQELNDTLHQKQEMIKVQSRKIEHKVQSKEIEHKVQSKEIEQFEGESKHERMTIVDQGKRGVLNSYKMSDNPQYMNISYTMMVLQKAITEHQQTDIQGNYEDEKEGHESKCSQDQKESNANEEADNRYASRDKDKEKMSRQVIVDMRSIRTQKQQINMEIGQVDEMLSTNRNLHQRQCLSE